MKDGCAESTNLPDIEVVKTALGAILACADVRLSERNRRFLSFVVTETIAGNSERIKAYTIGVDVFGRNDSFDPSTDPIVRIEATRIRSALAAYYDGPGLYEPLRISIPPGSYVPAFSWSPRSRPLEVVRHLSTSPVGPRAIVVIEDHSPRSDAEEAWRGELFAEALARRLTVAGLKVHFVPASDRSAARAAIRRIYARPKRAYSLDIAVRPLTGQRRYSWRLSDLSTGEVLAVDCSDHDMAATPGLEVIDGIADGVAEKAAALHGEIGRQERSGS